VLSYLTLVHRHSTIFYFIKTIFQLILFFVRFLWTKLFIEGVGYFSKIGRRQGLPNAECGLRLPAPPSVGTGAVSQELRNARRSRSATGVSKAVAQAGSPKRSCIPTSKRRIFLPSEQFFPVQPLPEGDHQ
jgi:hypothetical protein